MKVKSLKVCLGGVDGQTQVGHQVRARLMIYIVELSDGNNETEKVKE